MTTWIVGAGGQDGRILSSELEATGKDLILQFSREIDFPNGSKQAINGLNTDKASEIINEFNVEHIYFLAAHSRPSSVRQQEKENVAQKYLQVEALFESICKAALLEEKEISIFLASSSLIFSGSTQSPQNEETAPTPIEPYALSKVIMTEILYEYSKKSDLIRPVVGIFYNHESTLRTQRYLSHRVINHALDIHSGAKTIPKLNLKTGENCFDISHANDFIYNLIELMKTNFAGNCIFSSGSSISIQEFCNFVFQELNLNYEEHIYFEDKNIIDEANIELVGDNSLLKSSIMEPKISHPSQTVKRLVNEWEEKRLTHEK